MQAPIQDELHDSQKMAHMAEIVNLVRRARSGASNFYWIAGLSVINSLITLFGGGTRFVVGLGLTMIIDFLAYDIAGQIPGNAALVKGIGFALGLAINGIFVLFGIFAAKGKRWAFIVGMLLYGLDSLLSLVLQDWFGFGFHLFLLWGVFTGFQAATKLQKLQTGADAIFPKADIGG